MTRPLRPVEEKGVHPPLTPLGEALRGRGLLHWIRQSTKRQFLANLGSREEQIAQWRYGEPYGITPDSPRYYRLDAKAETAQRLVRRNGAVKHRKVFETLLEQLETGNYGVVLVALLDRLVRNKLDEGRLLDVMQRHKVVFFAGGRTYDPRDPVDELHISTQFALAAFGGSQLRASTIKTRQRRAASGELIQRLPTGLTYGNPLEERFRQAMEGAGLGEALRAVPEQSAPFGSAHREHKLYVFPMPDMEVLAAAQTVFRLLLERRTCARVALAIREGVEGWPAGRTGLLPVVPRSVWYESIQVSWVPVTSVRIRAWLLSPKLWGIYRYDSPAYAELPRQAEISEGVRLPAQVEITGRIVGLFPADAFATALQYIRRPERRLRLGESGHARPDDVADGAPTPASKPSPHRFVGARNHLLADLRCGELVRSKAGVPERCGSPYHPIYDPDGGYHYARVRCQEHLVHVQRVSPVIEGLVLDAALASVSARRVEALFASIRLRATGASGKSDLEKTLKSKQAELERARNAYSFALSKRNEREAGAQFDLATRLGDEIDALKAQLDSRGDDNLELARVRQADLRRLQSLGADLRALFDEARRVEAEVDAVARRAGNGPAPARSAENAPWVAYEGMRRALLRALKPRVYVSRTEAGLIRLSIELPNGEIVEHEVAAEYRPKAQAARLWFAAGMARTPAAAAALADRANHALAAAREAGVWSPIVPEHWTGPQVAAAALYHERCEHVVPPTRGLTSIRSLAARIGEPYDAVLGAALLGRLGPAVAGSRGRPDLRVSVSAATLERLFREHARRQVSAREGWPVDDTVLVTELARELGVTDDQVRSRLRFRGQVVRDLAGTRWTRRSGAALSDQAALRAKLDSDPALAKTRFEWWVPRSRALEQYPVGKKTLLQVTHVVRLREHGPQHSSVYVYLDPATRARLERPTLAEAVRRHNASGGERLDPEDFRPRAEVAAVLKAAGTPVTARRWRRLVAEGAILEVSARARKRGRMEQWAYFPRALRAGEGAALEAAFLSARTPDRATRLRAAPGTGARARARRAKEARRAACVSTGVKLRRITGENCTLGIRSAGWCSERAR